MAPSRNNVPWRAQIQDFCKTINTDICWKEVQLLSMIKERGIIQMVKTDMMQL